MENGIDGSFLSGSRMRVRASAVCVWGGRVLTVRATDPVTRRGYLFLPGGAVESGETAAAAAERETLEETGYAVAAGAGEPLVREYTFDWAGRPWACRTSFVAAELVDGAAPPAAVHDADYIGAAEWVALDRVDEVFAYHDVVLAAVRDVLAGVRAG